VRRGQTGRPVIFREVRDLIRKMCRTIPVGVATPHPRGTLKLGIDIGGEQRQKIWCAATSRRLRLAHISGESRQAARLHRLLHGAHYPFPGLYVFLVLAHDRRRILHFNVTATDQRSGPTATAGGLSL